MLSCLVRLVPAPAVCSHTTKRSRTTNPKRRSESAMITWHPVLAASSPKAPPKCSLLCATGHLVIWSFGSLMDKGGRAEEAQPLAFTCDESRLYCVHQYAGSVGGS
eukprot:3756270-Pyramimonas_sp.AAC.1